MCLMFKSRDKFVSLHLCDIEAQKLHQQGLKIHGGIDVN